LKLIDTNVFVRAIAPNSTRQDELMRQVAVRLFDHIGTGVEEAWTLENVVNEVLYVLCVPYGLSRTDALDLFLPLFRLEGLRIARKRLYADALELFRNDSALDFTDCVLAVFAKEDGYELATFDRRLARTAGVEVYSG
jgi:predicted nucleic acid-binding protein